MSPPPATERLRRVLAMVPWLAARGGATLDELAARFGITKQQAQSDVFLASVCGVPPFGADCLVDVWLDDDDRVEVGPGQLLKRPPRLTVGEGFAVLTAGRALQMVPGADEGGALARALDKLEAVLGDADQLAVDAGRPPLLQAIHDAVRARRRVRATYFSAYRDELSDRHLEPHVDYQRGGRWYVDAFSPETGDVRRYRVDRIRSLTETGETFDPPPDPQPPVHVFEPPHDAQKVTIDAPAAQARWAVESYDTEATQEDGRLHITFTVVGSAWLERLLLRLGPDARVVDPTELVDTKRTVAKRLLERYRDTPTSIA